MGSVEKYAEKLLTLLLFPNIGIAKLEGCRCTLSVSTPQPHKAKQKKGRKRNRVRRMGKEQLMPTKKRWTYS